MVKRWLGFLVIFVVILMMSAVSFGQTDPGTPVKHFLDPTVENVVLWVAAYLIGLLNQKSKVWNEFIPVVRYAIFLLAHSLGVGAADAGETIRTVAVPTDPGSASVVDLAVVTVFDNVLHKGLRLIYKLLKKEPPDWL